MVFEHHLKCRKEAYEKNDSYRSPSVINTFVHLCMECSLGISNFLEEISSLSHSIVFLYFFA